MLAALSRAGSDLATVATPMVEVVELLLNAVCVGVAALLPVQPQRIPPHDTGLLILAQSDIRMAQGIKVSAVS